MNFAAIVNKTWNENLLFSVLVELTYRCNLNCFFCYNDLALEGMPLSREQYERFFEDLAGMQVFNLVLSGGEPLAHPEFFALGAKARELGFVIRLKSNGHALNGQVAERLRQEVDPFLVEVSLHGARAATHDKQTRVPGSFDQLLRNLRQMREIGLRVKINSTMTRWNEDEVEAMLTLAADLSVPIHIDPVVTPRDDGDTSPLSIAPSREGVERLLRIQQEASQPAPESTETGGEGLESPAAFTVGRQADELMPATAKGKHCGAGSGGIAVDPFGNIYPCVQWRRSVGNLHQQSIREIWRGSPKLEEIRQLNEEVKTNLEEYGTWGQGLNFCPGSAVQETGSPFGIYDSAHRRADAVAVVRAKGRNPLPIVP